MSSPEPEQSTACFFVTAQAAPGVLPRVMELFAKRGLTPHALNARRSAGGALTIDIRMADMEPDLAHYIGRCLDRIFEVDSVLVSERRYADVA